MTGKLGPQQAESRPGATWEKSTGQNHVGKACGWERTGTQSEPAHLLSPSRRGVVQVRSGQGAGVGSQLGVCCFLPVGLPVSPPWSGPPAAGFLVPKAAVCFSCSGWVGKADAGDFVVARDKSQLQPCSFDDLGCSLLRRLL